MTATQQRDLHGLKALVTEPRPAWAARSPFSSRGMAPTSLCMAATRGAVSRRSKKSSCRAIRAHFVAADLADATEHRPFRQGGWRLDILVNNAGFAVWGSNGDVRGRVLRRDSSPRMSGRRSSSSPHSRQAWWRVGRGASSNISSMAGRLGLYGRRGVRGDQSGSGFIHAGMGGGVQPARHPGQCGRARPDLHTPRGAGTLRLARSRHGHEACGRPRGDR